MNAPSVQALPPLLERLAHEVRTAGEFARISDYLWKILHAALAKVGFAEGTEWVTVCDFSADYLTTSSEVVDLSSRQVIRIFVDMEIATNNDEWHFLVDAVSAEDGQPRSEQRTLARTSIKKNAPTSFLERHFGLGRNLRAYAENHELRDFGLVADAFAASLSEALAA